MTRLQDKPTPEWEARQGGNVVWSGQERGGEEHLQVLYVIHYDILKHADCLDQDYTHGMDRYCGARRAFNISLGAHSGHLGMKSGEIKEGQADFRALVQLLPKEAMRTLDMLAEEITGGMQQVNATKPYLFAQIASVEKALIMMEEAFERIDNGDIPIMQKDTI